MKKLSIALFTVSYFSGAVYAVTASNSDSDFGASVFIGAEQTDNALKSKEDEISELQYRIGGTAFADYENDYLALNANYTLSEMHYDKDTQDKRTTTMGRTELTFGKPYQTFDLKIQHSIQRLPKHSDALDLDSENDEKQILSIQPGFHKRIGRVGYVFANANATEVDYRFEENKNSSRSGGTLGLVHNFSPIDSVSLYVSQTDIEFEYNSEVDYSQAMAVAAFERQLRKINYRIEAGQSRTDSVRLGVSDDPYYMLRINYRADYHRVDFTANQQVTDSSRGFNANGIPGETSWGSDVTSEEVDQVLLRHAEVRWTTTALCGRCNFYVSAYGDSHEFQSSEREEERLGGTMGLSYRLSRNAQVGMSMSRLDQEVKSTTGESNYILDQITAHYTYSFINGLRLRVFAAEQDRSAADNNNEYTEFRAGVSVGYTF